MTAMKTLILAALIFAASLSGNLPSGGYKETRSQTLTLRGDEPCLNR